MFGRDKRHLRGQDSAWVSCCWLALSILLISSFSMARDDRPGRFVATFAGTLVDSEVGRFAAHVTLAGEVSEVQLGEGTFEAEGYLNLVTETGQGQVTIRFPGGTLTLQMSGFRSGADRFTGIYKVSGGSGDYEGSEGAGYVTGTFDLTEMSFEGKALGTLEE